MFNYALDSQAGCLDHTPTGDKEDTNESDVLGRKLQCQWVHGSGIQLGGKYAGLCDGCIMNDTE